MRNRILGFAGSLLVLFGIFVPLVSLQFVSVTLFDMGVKSIPFFVVALLVFIPTFLEYGLYQIVAGIGIMVLLVHEWNAYLSDNIIMKIASLFVSKGMGFYLILFGGMIMCISGVVSITKNKIGRF